MVSLHEFHHYIAFEAHRTGSRPINNFIYTLLTVKYMALPCCFPFRLSDVIESFTELSPDNQEDDENPSKTVFKTQQFMNQPICFLGANIPSIYGGHTVNPWEKNKNSFLLPKALVKSQNQEQKQGIATTSDFKLEFMG